MYASHSANAPPARTTDPKAPSITPGPSSLPGVSMLVRIGPHATRHQITHAIHTLRARAKQTTGDERAALDQAIDDLLEQWVEAEQ